MKMSLYALLGLDESCTQEEIRKAYRKLALKYHPDRNGGDEEKFKEIAEAYEILSNPDRKRAYDLYGSTDPSAKIDPYSEGIAPDIFQGMDAFQVFQSVFSDVAAQMAKERNQAQERNKPNSTCGDTRKVQRSTDVFFEITISFPELISGCKKKLAIRRNRLCHLCGGLGVTFEDEPVDIKCIQCHGKGRQSMVKPSFLGDQVQEITCAFCQGEGIKAPISMPKCPTCKGGRLVTERAIFEAIIDAGIPDGHQIICQGQGDDSILAETTTGDVILKVTSTLPSGWTRFRQHLIHHVDISLSESLFGVNKTITHPDGSKFSLVIRDPIKPLLVSDLGVLSPWFVPGLGLPAFGTFPEGMVIVVLHIVYPTKTDELVKQMEHALVNKTETEPGSTEEVKVRAPTSVLEIEMMRQLFTVAE